MIRNGILITVVVMAVALLTACTDHVERQGQELLAQADSALADGRYLRIDSLLAVYDSTAQPTAAS